MNNLKRIGIKAIAAAATMAALASGCDTKERSVEQTELPTITASLNPVTTPPTTIVVTPTIEPTPEVTPEPTPTIDPLGLNSYEDIFNEEVINHETQRFIDQYLQTTFVWGKTAVPEEEIKNLIAWRGIPTGNINEENFNITLERIETLKNGELNALARILEGEKEVKGEIILLSLEPMFINGSPAEKLYLQLFEIEKSLFNNSTNQKGLEISQEVVNYVNENFVEKDNFLQEIDNSYDRYWLLYEMNRLDNLARIYNDDLIPTNGENKYTDIWGYLKVYMPKYSEYLEQAEVGIITEVKEAKNSYSLN